jgi:hypothetical protein
MTFSSNGVYLIQASAPGTSCNFHKIRLWQVSPVTAVVAIGTSEYIQFVNASDFATTRSHLAKILTVTNAPEVYEIQHFFRTTDGLAFYGGFTSGIQDFPITGEPREVYTHVYIHRLS